MPIIRRSSFVIPLILLAACRNTAAPETELPREEVGPLPTLPSPAMPVAVGELLLSAFSALGGNESDPPRVRIGVMARNTTLDPVSLEGLCVVQLRAFRDSTTAAAPAWKAPQRPAASCPSPDGLREIPPGGKFHVHAAGAFEFPRVLDILGDSLPEGRYAFEALVRIGGDTVAVPAGTLPLSADTRPPLQAPDLLHYAAETRVEGTGPRELVARVVATNPTDRNIYLEYGACSLRLRAYRTPERTGRPLWHSEYRQPPGSEFGYACPGYLATQLVAPGEVISPAEFNARIPLYEVLGDSLLDGRYYFTAVLEFQSGAGTTLANDTVRIPAGSADLTSSGDPLPQEREVGGIRYHAETAPDPAAPGMLRLTLSATNVEADRVLLLGSQGVTCPSQLLGYRSAERRDRWYLERFADWTAPSCPLQIAPTWLTPGETQTFAASVPSRAGQAGAGRYYLALVLWLEQEPQEGPGRVVLSAGDAILREP